VARTAHPQAASGTGSTLRVWGRAADALRALALVSALVTVPYQPLEAPLRFALVFVLLLVTRAIAMPRPFDAVFAALLLVSAWSSALAWYFEHPWIDVPIHFALTGATAAMLWLGLARLDLLPHPQRQTTAKRIGGTVLLVALLGGTSAVLWEGYEFLAERYLPSRILVGYADTIGDMAVGLLGAVAAGGAVAWWERTGHGLRAR
jgi:hypothetical protein